MYALFQNRRGFTVIELFTAATIIAVLLAILMPAIQQSRESARKATCKSNLKQIGVGLHAYFDSHNEHFPLPPTLPGLLPFMSISMNDAKSEIPILVCPTQGQTWPFGKAGATYMTNAYVSGSRLQNVIDPKTQTAYSGEGAQFAFMDAGETPCTDLGSSPHFHGGHILFLDGHVPFLSENVSAEIQSYFWLPDDQNILGIP